MELKDHIETGIKKTGSTKALAEVLEIAANSVTDAKNQRRGLPNDACVKLAQITGANPLDVIAASELATEKKPEKRAFWMAYQARVAGIALAFGITTFTTPTPAEAAPMLNSAYDIVFIM